MSKRAVPSQHPEDTQVGGVMTLRDYNHSQVDLVHIDEIELRSWLDHFSNRSLQIVKDSFLNVETVISLLREMCYLLNHRWRTSMTQNILIEFFRCMAKHGVPYQYVICSYSSRFLTREEYPGKYVSTMNIKLFFQELSYLEYKLRSSIWTFHHIQMGTTPSGKPSLLSSSCCSNISTLRYQLCNACRNLNYRAVVASLANSETMRMTSEIIERPEQWKREVNYNIQHLIYFDSPLVIWVALQATLAMKHESSFNVCKRLVMLATLQSLVYTTKAAMNSILMQLCEVLIATMLLGDTSYTCEIIMLESKVHRYNKNYENSFVWSAYKLIAEYEKWRRQPNSGGMISNTAQSLAETAETMSCHGTLFLEAACHIWAKLERCEDKIFKAISEVLISCPQLLGRIIRLLKVLEFEHEVEVFVAEVCDKQDTTLSPCDPVWVDWCKPRVQHPEKYGKRAEVILRCVKVLFQFLDYGSNRGYGEAWILLYTAIKHIEPTQIVALWAERYDWWPQFHTVHLPLEAGSRRAELLAALQRLPTE